MKKRTLHIAILALFQIMVFVTPFFVKVSHHHFAQNPDFYKTVRISNAVDNCYICQFEFVSFIAKSDPEYRIIRNITPFTFPSACQNGFKPQFSLFSLRAPPLS